MRFLLNTTSVIYADNAATTRLSESAFEAMLPFLQEEYGNASALYTSGANARRAIEKARRQVAASLRSQPEEIVFTSGGSESNNWVLRGVAEHFGPQNTHIIVSAVEHLSILNCCRALKQQGVEVTILPVNPEGYIFVEDIKNAIKDKTRIVSVMAANNEVGTLQPVTEIGELLKDTSILFHTDAVQAVGQIPVNIPEWKIDLLSASAHKFNGPKGIGFLFKKRGVSLPPLISGGDQEQSLRAGTENVAAIAALGAALEESTAELAGFAEKKRKLRDFTFEKIRECIPTVKINGDLAHGLPGILNMSFGSASGEALAHLLALKGIYVSTSAACSVGKEQSSHVLLAMGLSEQEARSSLRISYGRYNTKKEALALSEILTWAYKKVCTSISKI